MESVCRRRTSFQVQLPEPSPDVADAYTVIPNYRPTLTYKLYFFHMHAVMNTYCACIQEGVPGWPGGVIDDGLPKPIGPLPIHTFLLALG